MTDATDSTDAELAASIATAAGELLSVLRSAGTFSGKALGDEGDRQANDAILARLSSARPNDAVLSEESVDTPARLHADRCWIIDPLDGTREYVIPGRSDWAVHVALWERGREITAVMREHRRAHARLWMPGGRTVVGSKGVIEAPRH